MERPLYWPLRRPPEAMFEGIHVALGDGWSKYHDKVPEGCEPVGVVTLFGQKPAALFIVERLPKSSDEYTALFHRDDRFVMARGGEVLPLPGLDAFWTSFALEQAIKNAEAYVRDLKRGKKSQDLVGLANKARWLEKNIKRLLGDSPQLDCWQWERARELSKKFPTPSRTAELAALISAMNINTLRFFLTDIGLWGERFQWAITERLFVLENELSASTNQGEKV